MSLDAVLATLQRNADFMSQVVTWRRLPARPPRYTPPPADLSPHVLTALRQRGIEPFYTHQAAAITAALQGQNVIVATATASGKSLCYTVPVLHTLLTQPQARALYLFPTKALAHDQLAETAALIAAGRLPVAIHPYDGDTPQSQRRQARQAAGILLTNPDMLHSGILPYHTGWRAFFANLRFVVVDEIHSYRGVFGSHVANVLRRLRRLCRFYGSDPQFIATSATIANPQAHAERLLEASFILVDETQNGAPTGEKQFILYNPPLVDAALGLRQSTVLVAKEAAAAFLAQDAQTVVFARARQTVELLLAYLQDEMTLRGQKPERVAGYRGGYLPLERRAIESGLRAGSIRGVVATNALELGIDIGELSAAVLTGYPGSIASTWQQAGRAGRRADQSVAVLVAGSGPLDQYLCQHPEYLFGRSPEQALVNPDNLRLLARHLLCAAYELPFGRGEPFGRLGPVDELLETLAAEGHLHRTRQQYHWLGEGLPAHHVSLRTSGEETVIIQSVGQAAGLPERNPADCVTVGQVGNLPYEVIGEVDLDSAPLLVHEGAIYMHQARSYLVEKLDWDGRLATVRPVEVDYYTRAAVNSAVRRLSPATETQAGDLAWAYGEVLVVSQATGYRKIKRYSHETLGYGKIELPATELDTAGYWLVFGERLTEELVEAGLLLRPNDYGPNWEQQRQKALARDGYRCRVCGATAENPAGFLKPAGFSLHVHHVRPFRDFGYAPGENEAYRQANELDNLITLCPSCHRQAEVGQRTRSALAGLGYLLGNLAPLFVMCDPADLQVSVDSRSPLTQSPTVVVYEQVAAGVGLSQRLYELHYELLAAALERVSECPCADGCPACVGPPGEIGPETKAATRQLLRRIA
ncbi:MAG: DEAD/DEAH box helicase [Chloroflexota bacterium]